MEISLTKAQAIVLMHLGIKITHRSFSSVEWMTLEGNTIVMEDGVRTTMKDFFAYRSSENWDDGYSIFLNLQKTDNQQKTDTMEKEVEIKWALVNPSGIIHCGLVKRTRTEVIKEWCKYWGKPSTWSGHYKRGYRVKKVRVTIEEI